MAFSLQSFTTPDPDYIAKHNANNDATAAAVTALQQGKLDAAQAGTPGGVATLGSDGKLSATQLPAVDLGAYQQASEKNQRGGYAGLDANGYLLVGTITIAFGSYAPEGVLAAPVGSLYLRTGGGPGTTLYVKEIGTGNTGWAAK